MTEIEVTTNFAAVLENIRNGPVALIRSLYPKARLLSESIAVAEARGSLATLDEGLMNDVDEGIANRSQPWNPPRSSTSEFAKRV